ncbi:TetR/AcrR family transcriptional regulator [Actinomycetospora flava]|uniref:TetR/AcrR family transcriptional regulator n=1 Tax=Actinomycetospora flava TaxID=3129232 RepID=A0ABU8MC83_9PSEU
MSEQPDRAVGDGTPPRRRRVDARQNMDALVAAATAVFADEGVDAPAKQITDRAGLGVGTLYRHFPRRSDLVLAVLRHEIDTCADAVATLGAAHDPETALVAWLDRYTALLAHKQGLAHALHSEDPAFEALRGHFDARIEPALRPLLAAAAATGRVRDDLDAQELLHAVALLCLPVPGEEPGHRDRRLAVFLDGLRCTSAGEGPAPSPPARRPS